MLVYLAIIIVASLTTTTLAMFCSVVFQKTSTSMITAYLLVIVLFALPIAVKTFADTFSPATAALVHHEPTGKIATAAQFGFVGPKGGQGDIALLGGESLADVMAKINAQTQDSGVMAVVQGNDLLIRQEGLDASLPVGFRVFEGEFDTTVPATIQLRRAMFVSPFAAALAMPLSLNADELAHSGANWWRWTPISFLGFYLVLDGLLVGAMIRLFKIRWRVAQ